MSRPLQVGDRVAVYGAIFSTKKKEYFGSAVDWRKGEVVGTVQAGDMIVFKDEWGEDFTAHPKQCRRLVKKERRRVWVYQDRLGSITEQPTAYYRDQPPDDSPGHWVEFIEVRRK